jgi:heme-degrading monooxygenase HmoA
MHAWRTHPEHVEAQRKARAIYYSEYHIQVCEVLRERKFQRADAA